MSKSVGEGKVSFRSKFRETPSVLESSETFWGGIPPKPKTFLKFFSVFGGCPPKMFQNLPKREEGSYFGKEIVMALCSIEATDTTESFFAFLQRGEGGGRLGFTSSASPSTIWM